jgi:hypothetical protein
LEDEHLGKRPLEERVTSSQLTILLQSSLQIFRTVSKREVPVLNYKGEMSEEFKETEAILGYFADFCIIDRGL